MNVKLLKYAAPVIKDIWIIPDLLKWYLIVRLDCVMQRK